MKARRLIISILALILAFSVLSLFSCGKVESEGRVTVVIEGADGEYEIYGIDLSEVENKDGAVSILEALAAREDKPLALDMTDGSYGKMINSIGGLNPDATKNEYVAIYTSVEEDFDVSEYKKTLTYEGRTLATSGVGISGMSASDGTVILFRTETW